MAIDWFSRIETQLGEHVKLGAAMEDPKQKIFKSSSPSLNWALGGGIAAGKVFTVYGPESAGKSLVGYDFIAQLHKADPTAWAFLYDAEYNFNKPYVERMGVDTKRLLVAQTNKPSEIFDHFYDVIWPMMQEGFPLKMVMIDSIKSIRGSKETATKSVDDHVMADLPQLLSKASRKWIEPIRKHGVAVILVQQVNMEMDANLVKYQNKKWNVPNGQALKHWSDYMLLVERIERKDAKMFDKEHATLVESNKDGIQVGHMVRCKVEKNRVGSPYRIAEFTLQYGKGIVNGWEELAELAVALKVVNRPNAQMYEFGETRVRGRDAWVAAVRDDQGLQGRLSTAIDAALDSTGLTFDKSESVISGDDDFDVSLPEEA
jgi:recombination protein RecA